VVDALCQKLEAESWEVIRDKTALHPGDLISDFMKAIAQADQVVVVLSDKYLRSPYCMTELHGIYQRAQGEKSDFLEHVIPLALNDAKMISLWRERATFSFLVSAQTIRCSRSRYRSLSIVITLPSPKTSRCVSVKSKPRRKTRASRS
jgi:hypothetical protein